MALLSHEEGPATALSALVSWDCVAMWMMPDVYSSFICNCKNLEGSKTSFSRQMDKPQHILTMNIIQC